MVTKMYLPIYLRNSSDSSDSFDSCYSCDSSDSSDSGDGWDRSDSSDNSDKKNSVTIFPPLKLWQNSKTQMVTKPNNSNCDKTQKHKLWKKVKKWKCDKPQKLKLWQNSTIQIVTKLKNTNWNKN